MKKRVCIWTFLIMLCAGCSSMGSFEDEDIDLNQALLKIEKQIASEDWQIATLNEAGMDEANLLDTYGLNTQQMQDWIVKQAVIPAEVGEIAIFHVSEAQEQDVKDAIVNRVTQMKSEVKGLADQEQVIDHYQIGQFGAYIVFVVGNDATSVLQYISSL